MKKFFQHIIFCTTIFIPFYLFAETNFYAGINVIGEYVPKEKIEFTEWSKQVNTNIYQLDGESITGKTNYATGGSLSIGYLAENYTQFELELGATLSSNISIEKTTIPASSNSTVKSIYGDDLVKSTIYFALLNGYINITSIGTSKLMPYIGAGIGFAQYRMDFTENTINTNFTIDDIKNTSQNNLRDVLNNVTKKNSILINATGGFNAVITKNSILGIGYRFLSSPGTITLGGETTTTDTTTKKIKYRFVRHSGIMQIKFVF